MTLEEALALLFDTVRNNKRHKDYKRVVDLATLYNQLITGQNINALLKQFVRREDKSSFDQRVQITQQLCPAWADSIMTPFYKVGRLDNVKRVIGFSDAEGSDRKRAEIEDAIGEFYGHESLEEYLATRFVELSFTDPNSFIVVEFDDFDPNVEKARPYPIEYSSTQAVNYLYKNNILQWLIIQEDPVPVVLADGTKRQAAAWRMYLPDLAIRLVQTFEFENQLTNVTLGAVNNQVINGYWQQNSSQVYEVTIAQPGGGEIQAIRVGYKRDLSTAGRTFVNPFNAALPYFMKSIESVSRADLSQCLHAFPQKVQYVEKCDGYKENTCKNGKDDRDRTCKACKGSGVKVHTSAQDAILLAFPKPNVTTPLKVTEVIAYVTPPIDLLKFQSDEIDALEAKAKRMVYNAETLVKTTVEDTATGVIATKDEMNNTFFPYAKAAARTWKFATRLTAVFIDCSLGLELVYNYPKDLKLQSVVELIATLKLAADSGAPSFLIQSIQRDIASKVNVDDEQGYLKIIVKERFTPFLGKSSEEIMFILTSGFARLEDQILWTHSDTIFDDLEQQEPGFFSFTYDKQWPLIKKQIDKIAAALPTPATAMSFGAEVSGLPGDGATGSEPRIGLRNSVGGSQIINDVRLQVAKKFATYEAAVKQLQVQLGYTEQEAKDLIGTPQDLGNQVKEGKIAATT